MCAITGPQAAGASHWLVLTTVERQFRTFSSLRPAR